jgi:exosortase E/protease (VPEID-CTERM system)
VASTGSANRLAVVTASEQAARPGILPWRPARYASLATWTSPFWRELVRWVILLGLLAAELVALTPPSNIVSPVDEASFWAWLWVRFLYQIRPALVSGFIATLFLSWSVARHEFRHCLERSGVRRLARLAAHLLLVGALFAWRASLVAEAKVSQGKAELWLVLWAAMALPIFATWLAAALPPRFWIRWLTRSRGAFLAGAVVGLAADLLAGATENLWWPLRWTTFAIVSLLLRLTGQSVVAHPQQLVIGTPAFSVQIWAQCSGLEGVGLISAFVAAYIWFYRHELRFPRALLLLPIGAIAIWLTNSVRIAALILIGGWSPGVGFKGFHSVAGWLFFNLVACGVIWMAWRSGLFAKPGSRSISDSTPNPATVYLVPFLAIISVSMITRAFSAGFEVLYPLRVVAAASAFYFYRRELAAMRWSISVWAVILGALVFFLWLALAHRGAPAATASSAALGGMPTYIATLWLLFRVAGSVITAPLAEELTFRGYLTRRLVASDFASVALGQFTWVSFLLSSALFGALHNSWLAGTLAGMIFAVALYRRGSLSDAVVAHSTANGLLAACALASGDWSLWS